MTVSKKQIAVLGGGIGSLSAVYGLTSQSGWQDQYEITVYQMGWRLGGKGATGRDPERGDRIQEHGFHAWFGFYENAFSMIREIYKEQNRSPDQPLSTWKQGFLPETRMVLEQTFNGVRHNWILDVPVNPSEPGDGTPMPGPVDYLVEMAQLLVDICRWALELEAPAPEASTPPPALTGLRRLLDSGLEAFKDGVEDLLDPLGWAQKLITLIGDIGEAIQSPGSGEPDGHPLICSLIRHIISAVQGHIGDRYKTELSAYRLWIAVEFLGLNILGILQYNLFANGFNSINELDYRAWLSGLDMSDVTLDSALVQAAYDSTFAFPKHGHPTIEAGTVLRGAMRQLMLYKGAPLWRFAEGTGDTIFAPLYNVLKARGVNFRFFHKIDEIITDGSDGNISRIRLSRQAVVRDGEYAPLFDLNGLPCWPQAPRWEQLVDGEALRASGVDFESYFSAHRGEPIELSVGADFDLVICGISVGALERMTPTLCQSSPQWQQMVTGIQTVRTQGIQLWVLESMEALGWTLGSALLSCDGEPMDTIADMSFLLEAEDWPTDCSPQGLVYLCGALDFRADEPMPPYTDTSYPAQQHELVYQTAMNWLTGHTHNKTPKMFDLWPDAYAKNAEGKWRFRWELLADQDSQAGPDRLKSQWIRANIEPTERYVLSVPGSSKLRLRSDQSGFDNLYLAGDWTDNGINAGCMEAAVISGLQASRGICGWPEIIPGEEDGLLGLVSPDH